MPYPYIWYDGSARSSFSSFYEDGETAAVPLAQSPIPLITKNTDFGYVLKSAIYVKNADSSGSGYEYEVVLIFQDSQLPLNELDLDLDDVWWSSRSLLPLVEDNHNGYHAVYFRVGDQITPDVDKGIVQGNTSTMMHYLTSGVSYTEPAVPIFTDRQLFLNYVQAPPVVISAGGGATHIAKVTGLLSSLSNNVSDILIVAGGGGGGGLDSTTPGNGGGYQGGSPKLNDTPVSGKSGTQSTGFGFGKGQGSANTPGGGGGFYGGYAAQHGVSGAGAGSGYLGASLLSGKVMYGNDVPVSSDIGTKTISVNSKSSTPITYKPKMGNGYARITYMRSIPEPPEEHYLFQPDFNTDGKDLVHYDASNTVPFDYDGYMNRDVIEGKMFWDDNENPYSIDNDYYVLSNGELQWKNTDPYTSYYYRAACWAFDAGKNQNVVSENGTITIACDIKRVATFDTSENNLPEIILDLYNTFNSSYELPYWGMMTINFLTYMGDSGHYFSMSAWERESGDSHGSISTDFDTTQYNVNTDMTLNEWYTFKYVIGLNNGYISTISLYINDTLRGTKQADPTYENAPCFYVDGSIPLKVECMILSCDSNVFKFKNLSIQYE